ncbi:type II CAAX endopeptidase family protein [Algoriphagus sp.]|uniref:CPBP family intramembrane glutamic endopeptidase n=1 Tax=Algoriphagus sp. TaxID=1872435 RepID=UPI0025DF7F88|nr:type II CAAX endopeptidase family protein [Algoriphagus sp.]
MKNLFINPETGIYRAGWRILSFIIFFMAINLSLTFVVREILGSLKGGGLLWFILLAISSTTAAFLSRKYVDKESLSSLGLNFNRLALLDVIIGVLTSALIMAAMYFLLLSLDLIKFEGFSWWSDNYSEGVNLSSASLIIMLGMLLQFSIVAWWEEIAFRGIILQNISKGLGLRWGIILSTILFGLIHAANPDATILSTLLIMIITIQLVYAYLKTGQLWMPIGLHLGWNFFQASIFGFASSGHSSPSMITQSPIGPDWLSGGEFGAENSVFIVPFTLVSLWAINYWVGKTRIPNRNSFLKFMVTKEGFDVGNKQQTNAPKHNSLEIRSIAR